MSILFLKEKNIYNPIKESINEFYGEVKVGNSYEIITQLVLTISDYTCSANNLLKDVRNADVKMKYQITLTELGIYLIRETYDVSGYSKEKYFRILKSTLRKVYHKHKWNFEELDRLLHLDTIEKFAEDNISIDKGNEVVDKKICLDWIGGKPLDLFIADFKMFFKIKNNKAIQYLFQPVVNQFEIYISPDQLPPLLFLFDSLHNNKVIKVKGNRGIFSYLENHIKPLKNTFPSREFRKVKYDLSKNEKLSKDIELVISKIFGKYLNAGQ